MRSRAAILPFAGDPFLLKYWLELFYRVWADEVDKLYVLCDTCIEPKVLEYIEFLCTADPDKITYVYNEKKEQHGDKILRGLLAAKEEYIILVEDDSYVFKSGMVDKCFKLLEGGNYDIVGSKRGSCAFEILQRAREMWGVDYEGAGDQGCNFWPCYFLSTRDLLLQTDRNFNSRAWVKGESIIPLGGYGVAVEVVAGDTFVNTSLQLRNMVPESRIIYTPQYHAHPDDVKHFEQKTEYTPFDGKACWTHIGSLSTGIGGILMDDQGRCLENRLIDPPKGPTILPRCCTTDMEKLEFERRVQFWMTFWENRDPDEIKEFADLYGAAISRIITQYQLSPKRIKERQRIYREAFNL
jgi:hypothetical protein